MPLIKGKRLPQRFAELVGRAEQVDVAVAWARPCEAVEVLARSGADLHIAIGISKSFTDPSTLKRLAGLQNVDLRIVPDDAHRIFHPKYYCFHGDKTICWIGSANLTGGGFGGNVELVHEFELKREEDQNWFESVWKSLEPDPWPTIREYEERYTPPGRTPRPVRPGPAVDRPSLADLPSLADIETWDDFVGGLRAYDTYYRYRECGFDVLGESHSWLHTIKTGHEIALLHDWQNLTQRECRILRGVTTQDDDEGSWALLGTIGFQANYALNSDHMPEIGADRQEIRRLVEPVVKAGDNVTDIADEAVQNIRAVRRVEGERPGVGHAAATRWLALARPDRCVSVNSASARRLGEASGQPRRSSELADVYRDLLIWLQGRRWFNEFNGSQPDDPQERVIWNHRAALVDVFVYKA